MNEPPTSPTKSIPFSVWWLPAFGAVVCLALGITSGWNVEGGGSVWYEGLAKPPGTPPPWVFGPVWTLLYLLMGVAAGLLVRRRAWRALRWFALQFVLNLAWTPVFFGSHQIWIGLVVIVALLATLIMTIVATWQVDRRIAFLLVPYALWVGYATYLNGAIAWLNG